MQSSNPAEPSSERPSLVRPHSARPLGAALRFFRLKLLLYSHFFAPSIGGVETLVESLARGLAGLSDASGQPQFAITLVTQTAVESFDDRSLPFPVIRRPSFMRLWNLIRACDVVHVAGVAIVPVVFGLLAGKAVVVEHHGFQAICPNGQLLIEPSNTPCPGHFMPGHHAICLRCNAGQGWLASLKLWLFTFLRRFLCRRVTCNITPTAWLGGLVQLPRTLAIPHGIRPEKFASERLTTPNEPPVIAFVGRLVTAKGVGVLLEAARILREEKRKFEVLLIGDGPERVPLEKIAQTPPLTGHVHFAGRLGYQELATALSTAAVLVAPSLGGEVFGLVVAESMLRGLPVIASDLGAFAEVLSDGGRTFPAGDAAALAREISKVLDDPAFAAELSRRASKRALAYFDFQRMLDAHAEVYRRAQS